MTTNAPPPAAPPRSVAAIRERHDAESHLFARRMSETPGDRAHADRGALLGVVDAVDAELPKPLMTGMPLHLRVRELLKMHRTNALGGKDWRAELEVAEAERLAAVRQMSDERARADQERARADRLAAFLRRGTTDGTIVSSEVLTPTEIAIARAGGRMLVTEDGYGFVCVASATGASPTRPGTCCARNPDGDACEREPHAHNAAIPHTATTGEGRVHWYDDGPPPPVTTAGPTRLEALRASVEAWRADNTPRNICATLDAAVALVDATTAPAPAAPVVRPRRWHANDCVERGCKGCGPVDVATPAAGPGEVDEVFRDLKQACAERDAAEAALAAERKAHGETREVLRTRLAEVEKLADGRLDALRNMSAERQGAMKERDALAERLGRAADAWRTYLRETTHVGEEYALQCLAQALEADAPAAPPPDPRPRPADLCTAEVGGHLCYREAGHKSPHQAVDVESRAVFTWGAEPAPLPDGDPRPLAEEGVRAACPADAERLEEWSRLGRNGSLRVIAWLVDEVRRLGGVGEGVRAFPRLTNPSALVLWRNGDASDGHNEDGEIDPHNMRKALAWCVERLGGVSR